MKRNVTAVMLLVLCTANVIIAPPKQNQEVELSSTNNQQNQDAVSATLLQLFIEDGALQPVKVYPKTEAFTQYFMQSTRNIKYVLQVLGMKKNGDKPIGFIKDFVTNLNSKSDLSAYYNKLEQMNLQTKPSIWHDAITAELDQSEQEKFFFLNGVAQLLSVCVSQQNNAKISFSEEPQKDSVNVINIKLTDLGDLGRVQDARKLIMKERAQFLERLTAKCIKETALHQDILNESGIGAFPVKATVKPASSSANGASASNGAAPSPAAQPAQTTQNASNENDRRAATRKGMCSPVSKSLWALTGACALVTGGIIFYQNSQNDNDANADLDKRGSTATSSTTTSTPEPKKCTATQLLEALAVNIGQLKEVNAEACSGYEDLSVADPKSCSRDEIQATEAELSKRLEAIQCEARVWSVFAREVSKFLNEQGEYITDLSTGVQMPDNGLRRVLKSRESLQGLSAQTTALQSGCSSTITDDSAFFDLMTTNVFIDKNVKTHEAEWQANIAKNCGQSCITDNVRAQFPEGYKGLIQACYSTRATIIQNVQKMFKGADQETQDKLNAILVESEQYYPIQAGKECERLTGWAQWVRAKITEHNLQSKICISDQDTSSISWACNGRDNFAPVGQCNQTTTVAPAITVPTTPPPSCDLAKNLEQLNGNLASLGCNQANVSATASCAQDSLQVLFDKIAAELEILTCETNKGVQSGVRAYITHISTFGWNITAPNKRLQDASNEHEAVRDALQSSRALSGMCQNALSADLTSYITGTSFNSKTQLSGLVDTWAERVREMCNAGTPQSCVTGSAQEAINAKYPKWKNLIQSCNAWYQNEQKALHDELNIDLTTEELKSLDAALRPSLIIIDKGKECIGLSQRLNEARQYLPDRFCLGQDNATAFANIACTDTVSSGPLRRSAAVCTDNMAALMTDQQPKSDSGIYSSKSCQDAMQIPSSEEINAARDKYQTNNAQGDWSNFPQYYIDKWKEQITAGCMNKGLFERPLSCMTSPQAVNAPFFADCKVLFESALIAQMNKLPAAYLTHKIFDSGLNKIITIKEKLEQLIKESVNNPLSNDVGSWINSIRNALPMELCDVNPASVTLNNAQQHQLLPSCSEGEDMPGLNELVTYTKNLFNTNQMYTIERFFSNERHCIDLAPLPQGKDHGQNICAKLHDALLTGLLTCYEASCYTGASAPEMPSVAKGKDCIGLTDHVSADSLYLSSCNDNLGRTSSIPERIRLLSNHGTSNRAIAAELQKAARVSVANYVALGAGYIADANLDATRGTQGTFGAGFTEVPEINTLALKGSSGSVYTPSAARKMLATWDKQSTTSEQVGYTYNNGDKMVLSTNADHSFGPYNLYEKTVITEDWDYSNQQNRAAKNFQMNCERFTKELYEKGQLPKEYASYAFLNWEKMYAGSMTQGERCPQRGSNVKVPRGPNVNGPSVDKFTRDIVGLTSLGLGPFVREIAVNGLFKGGDYNIAFDLSQFKSAFDSSKSILKFTGDLIDRYPRILEKVAEIHLDINEAEDSKNKLLKCPVYLSKVTGHTWDNYDLGVWSSRGTRVCYGIMADSNEMYKEKHRRPYEVQVLPRASYYYYKEFMMRFTNPAMSLLAQHMLLHHMHHIVFDLGLSIKKLNFSTLKDLDVEHDDAKTSEQNARKIYKAYAKAYPKSGNLFEKLDPIFKDVTCVPRSWNTPYILANIIGVDMHSKLTTQCTEAQLAQYYGKGNAEVIEKLAPVQLNKEEDTSSIIV